jgi:3-methylcrotonyl-CoA carboxylase beta subunit
MDVLKSSIDPTSEEYINNQKHHLSLREELMNKLNRVYQGGGEKYVEKHRKREKLLPRERIEKILDHGSPFLELSALAAQEVYDTEVPSAGVVTGIGTVCGVQCMFVANDATVKGGTYFPLTVKNM